jgi:DNA invertase Pin-like site-specific DNA recombinase
MLAARGVELRSLKENIDTTTPTGRPIFHVIAALAAFERDIISERTQAGLEAIRVRGRKGGRPRAIEKITPDRLARAKALYAAKQNSVAEIMALTGLKSRNVFYKYVVDGVATAINLVRIAAWLRGEPPAPTRVSAFERLFSAA